MNELAKYNKFLVAIAGALVAILTNHLGASSPYVLDAIAVVTALGVYQVANRG